MFNHSSGMADCVKQHTPLLSGYPVLESLLIMKVTASAPVTSEDNLLCVCVFLCLSKDNLVITKDSLTPCQF